MWWIPEWQLVACPGRVKKRVGKGNIYIKNILEETAVSNEILKLPHGLLELDRALKLFDMKKFKQNMNREMKRQYPDRSKIETQVGGKM